MKPIIAIYGPTHTGKTDLANALYAKFPSELISVDSVQIYKNFDIGSNKPSPEEIKKFPHHLIDILEPNEDFSVGDFKKRSLEIIQKADEDSKIPIFVGGTMMYFYSLFEGLADLPPRDDLIRAELNCDLETFSSGAGAFIFSPMLSNRVDFRAYSECRDKHFLPSPIDSRR